MVDEEKLPEEVPPIEPEAPRLKDRRQPYGVGEAKRRIVPNEAT